MAVVLRARDNRLGRVMALKVLAPALAADAGFRRRFIAESRAAAAGADQRATATATATSYLAYLAQLCNIGIRPPVSSAVSVPILRLYLR